MAKIDYSKVVISDKARQGMNINSDGLQYIGRMLSMQDDAYEEQFEELTGTLGQILKVLRSIKIDIGKINKRLDAIEVRVEQHEKRLQILEEITGLTNTARSA